MGLPPSQAQTASTFMGKILSRLHSLHSSPVGWPRCATGCGGPSSRKHRQQALVASAEGHLHQCTDCIIQGYGCPVQISKGGTLQGLRCAQAEGHCEGRSTRVPARAVPWVAVRASLPLQPQNARPLACSSSTGKLWAGDSSS